MLFIPSLNLQDNHCVQLLADNAVMAGSGNPAVALAQTLVDAGCEWLHLYDIQGRAHKQPYNTATISEILANVKVPVQLLGGFCDLKTIEHWLSQGLARAILGTLALQDPLFVKEACRAFPGKIAVSIEALDGQVRVENWSEAERMKALDLALRLEEHGAAAIIYSDIDREGSMGALNIEATADLAMALQTPVLAAGGITSVADLRALKTEEACGIAGVICGQALYDGRIKLAEALSLLSAPCTESFTL